MNMDVVEPAETMQCQTVYWLCPHICIQTFQIIMLSVLVSLLKKSKVTLFQLELVSAHCNTRQCKIVRQNEDYKHWRDQS